MMIKKRKFSVHGGVCVCWEVEGRERSGFIFCVDVSVIVFLHEFGLEVGGPLVWWKMFDLLHNAFWHLCKQFSFANYNQGWNTCEQIVLCINCLSLKFQFYLVFLYMIAQFLLFLLVLHTETVYLYIVPGLKLVKAIAD